MFRNWCPRTVFDFRFRRPPVSISTDKDSTLSPPFIWTANRSREGNWSPRTVSDFRFRIPPVSISTDKDSTLSPPFIWTASRSREGDSVSALQAIQSKNFKVKDITRLYNLIRKFPPYVHISFVWIPTHVSIQGNENVDKLAKAALNRTSSSGKLFCWSDLKPKVNARFGKKIGMLRGQTSSTKYSSTWEKISAKEVKEKV
ncbi:hypothetical protein PoB_004008300 [Plakobranchus ocellatus]|uniref:RNase H type-1 domain-containing protein n=1 Tax=Plakobranchus ocellatus TaxID=259542 RepID=A0AAV4B381_9GAST|nr:hypothetical protein PoB_004008300 [Plakobranchus ocellatus]